LTKQIKSGNIEANTKMSIFNQKREKLMKKALTLALAILPKGGVKPLPSGMGI